MTRPRIVLASTSPRRKELMQSIGVSFDVIPSHASEVVHERVSPGQYVETLARRKAEQVASQPSVANGSPCLVVGSDTIVVIDDEILGKPKSEGDAVATLQRLQGRSHHVYTGLCVVSLADGKQELQVGHSRTEVRMKSLTPNTIERYVATKEPMDKAGSYGIQGFGATLVSGIDGDYFTVVGLPIPMLADFLSSFGVSVF